MRANKMKWNVEKLDSIFDQKTTAPILKIPIPRMPMPDKLGVYWMQQNHHFNMRD